ncbi:cupin domain-containing protein [Streptomyces sp. NPDC005071]
MVSKQPSETLSTLVEQALPNVQGKAFTSAIVDFPPAARAVPHRHGNAFVYAYVLEGNVRSQLEGGPMRTYNQGENWVEPPGAHHILTENTYLETSLDQTLDALRPDKTPAAQIRS